MELQVCKRALQGLRAASVAEDVLQSNVDTPSQQGDATTTALTMGIGLLRGLLQKEDWETAPSGFEVEYRSYEQAQRAAGLEILGTHKWYITEKVMPAKLEAILSNMQTQLQQHGASTRPGTDQDAEIGSVTTTDEVEGVKRRRTDEVVAMETVTSPSAMGACTAQRWGHQE